ncbi:MAG: response regulator transcription factor [Defluviitaleaceae bacterium]|nr:response regulator transcription factor [Defluviitaleaceae bacterium]
MRERKIILVIHADQPDCIKLAETLSAAGYKVPAAAGFSEAVALTADLVMCWDSLPLERLHRHFFCPIIVLSGIRDEDSVANALDSGASDYLVQPFGGVEQLARIRAVLRDSAKNGSGAEDFSVGGLSINYPGRTVRADGRTVHLTPIEFRILALLAGNVGKVLTHEQIINEVWGPHNSDNLVLRVNMANIRRKIEPTPSEPRYILTEAGIGYRMAGE